MLHYKTFLGPCVFETPDQTAVHVQLPVFVNFTHPLKLQLPVNETSVSQISDLGLCAGTPPKVVTVSEFYERIEYALIGKQNEHDAIGISHACICNILRYLHFANSLRNICVV